MRCIGRDWTRREIEARCGRTQQLAGVRRMIHAEGPETGCEVIELRSGAGLACDILPGRGLDITACELDGMPVAWLAPNGVPRAVDAPPGTGFLASCAGGLLMTCGLQHVGPPDAVHGLHGRIHHLPAREVGASARWQGDELDLVVTGTIEEASLFGQRLRLQREIRCRAGTNRIDVSDRVENTGGNVAELMLLYHVNLGWPLLGPGCRLHLPGAGPSPRHPGEPVAGWDGWQDPAADQGERVFYHGPLRGNAVATVENPQAGLRLSLAWDADAMPHLVQWRMPGFGDHVLGLEPSTCRVDGHAAERAAGRVIDLAPGAAFTSRITFVLERC